MFLKSHVELAVDFDAVRAAMLRGPAVWLDGLAQLAERDRAQLLAACRLEGGGPCHPRLDVGQPISTDRVVSLPLRLQAAEPPAALCALEGSLDAAWLGAGRTHLAFQAQYPAHAGLALPPVDRALLHRVAETVASRFLRTVGRRLAEGCGVDQSSATSAVSSPVGESKCRTSL
jgi:hypothetical protein